MINFDYKLKRSKPADLWQEYCGFLDLSLSEYMEIQNRLMAEQIDLWCASPLGKDILHGQKPKSIREFRNMVPLTDYNDYADVLLCKKTEMLPEPPIMWIETTWEGGKHPIKRAPYTKGMLEAYSSNLMAVLLLCSSTGRGKSEVKSGDKVLYGLAPLPYPTGLIPLALKDQTSLEFLPSVREAQSLSFSDRNKLGFKLGMKRGLDYFFGMGSVAYYISQYLTSACGSGSGSGKSYSPSVVLRMLRAKHRANSEAREQLLPKDLFRLKGFVCAGTDNECYKDDLQRLWGIRPMEIFMGTEPTLIGTETWNKNGMYFFPDACFYEFIPESEMLKNLDDPSYKPYTCLMDEVVEGEKYEIVISVLHGGAFARYRVGDMYRCLSRSCSEDGTNIPRFQYIDRVPSIVDIGGFTRISAQSISSVIQLSGLPIKGWFARKEFNEKHHPFLHLYAELAPDALMNQAVSQRILVEHLTVYFQYIDQDYHDLQRILGMDPLKVTIVRCGTFEEYERRVGSPLRNVNPSSYEVAEFLKLQEENYSARGPSHG